jgi:tetratricopeptide (TPR) repeat protein/predicted Ser/Thr protein kinase
MKEDNDIPRFLVLSKLGEGGMGVVHLAYDRDLDRKVALKVIRSDHGEPTELEVRLMREAQALAKLANPHIVNIHDIIEYNGQACILMEFVDGETVRGWLVKGKRSWRDILDVFIQAAKGIASAHAEGILHRDIKPSNIMVGRDGRTRVMDFGVAKAVESIPTATVSLECNDAVVGCPSGGLTRTNQLVGTLGYMSPEQITSGEATMQSDQFAFFVALDEALYGRSSVRGLTRATAAVEAAGLQDAPRPREAGVPQWVRRVVERGLSVDPSRRLESMEAVVDALSSDPRDKRVRMALITGMVAIVASVVVVPPAYQRIRDQRAAHQCLTASEPVETSEINAYEQAGAAMNESSRQMWEAAGRGLMAYRDDIEDVWAAGCRDTIQEKIHDDQWLTLSQDCLAHRRVAMHGLLEIASKRGDEFAPYIARAVDKLPSVQDCAEDSYLLHHDIEGFSNSPVSAGLEKVKVLYFSDRFTEARALATELIPDVQGSELKIEIQYYITLCDEQLGAEFSDIQMYLIDAFHQASEIDAEELSIRVINSIVANLGFKQQRMDDALEWSRHGITRARAAKLTNSRTYAELLNTIGVVQVNRGDLDAAKGMLREALELFEVIAPRDHIVAVIKMNLAIIAINERDLEAADRELAEALEVSLESLGPSHPRTAMVYQNMGRVYFDRQEFDRALETNLHVIKIYEAVGELGDNYETAFINTKQNVAAVYAKQGRPAEAASIFEELLARYRKSKNPDEIAMSMILVNLSGVYTGLGEPKKAFVYASEGAVLREKLFGLEDKRTMSAIVMVGEAQYHMGQLDDAFATLERALSAGAKLPPDDPALAHPIGSLGRLYASRGDYVKAIEHIENALALGHDDPSMSNRGDLEFELARAYDSTENDVAAKAAAERARAVLIAEGHEDQASEVSAWLEARTGGAL